MAELANVSGIHPRDLCSNLGIDRKYYQILFVSHLNSNLKGVTSWAIFVNIHLYSTIMLDPIRHVTKP
jgi:hypothetical protein